MTRQLYGSVLASTVPGPGGLMGTLGRKAVWGAALALWVMVPTASASPSDRQGKVDRLLQEPSSGSPRPVIIRVRPDAKDRVRKRLPSSELSLLRPSPGPEG